MTDDDLAGPPLTRRVDWLFDIRMALSKIEPAIFRDLAKRRHPPWGENETTEMLVAASTILEQLELCGWIISRKPPLRAHSAPTPGAGLGREDEAPG